MYDYVCIHPLSKRREHLFASISVNVQRKYAARHEGTYRASVFLCVCERKRTALLRVASLVKVVVFMYSLRAQRGTKGTGRDHDCV